MSDNLRFPSGITITQARKDAKRVARDNNIDLKAALDLQPCKHGINLPWHKAMAWIKAGGKPIAQFSVPSGSGSHRFTQLTRQRPIGFLAGKSGTGKTAGAVHLMESAIKLGIEHITYIGIATPSHPDPHDVSMQRLLDLRNRHPSTINIKNGLLSRAGQTLIDIPLRRGELVVIDELPLVTRGVTLSDLLEWLDEYEAGALLTMQGVCDLAANDFRGQDFDSGLLRINFWMLGKLLPLDTSRYLSAKAIHENESLGDSEFRMFDANGWSGRIQFLSENPA